MKLAFPLMIGLVFVMNSTALGADKRSMTAGRFALELDGAVVSYVKSVEGGWAKGSSAAVRGNTVQANTLTIQVEPASGPLLDWVAATLQGDAKPKRGAIVTDATHRIEFSNALITETTFPALDGSSKEAAYIDVTLVAEEVISTVSARTNAVAAAPLAAAERSYSTGNFSLQLDGLDCGAVSRMDAFTIEHSTAISVTIPIDDAEQWRAWYDAPDTRSGQIILAGDMGSNDYSIPLRGVGIAAISESPQSITVEIYLE